MFNLVEEVIQNNFKDMTYNDNDISNIVVLVYTYQNCFMCNINRDFIVDVSNQYFLLRMDLGKIELRG